MTYQTETWARPAAPAAKRPRTLSAAIVVAVVAGITAITNGVLILAGGRELIMDLLAGSAGLPEGSVTQEDLSLLEGITGTSLEDLQSTLATRAYLVLGFGILLVLFAVLMRNAAVWARALMTGSAVLALVFSGVVIADATTPPMAILCLLAILGCLAAVILTWLPANSRYAKGAR